MKVSTDAVLLGALANGNNPKQILDIGTGTGVIALMLAQRYEEAKILGVEQDKSAAIQALDNFQASPFSSQLEIWDGKIQEFHADIHFDLIVSNPPFFSNHLPSSDQKRQQAIHTELLPFEDLTCKVEELLAPGGNFWVILPPREMQSLTELMGRRGLNCREQIAIQDRPERQLHRMIARFSKIPGIQSNSTCVLKDLTGSYTAQYRALLSGFLLGYQ